MSFGAVGLMEAGAAPGASDGHWLWRVRTSSHGVSEQKGSLGRVLLWGLCLLQRCFINSSEGRNPPQSRAQPPAPVVVTVAFTESLNGRGWKGRLRII